MHLLDASGGDFRPPLAQQFVEPLLLCVKSCRDGPRSTALEYFAGKRRRLAAVDLVSPVFDLPTNDRLTVFSDHSLPSRFGCNPIRGALCAYLHRDKHLKTAGQGALNCLARGSARFSRAARLVI